MSLIKHKITVELIVECSKCDKKNVYDISNLSFPYNTYQEMLKHRKSKMRDQLYVDGWSTDDKCENLVCPDCVKKSEEEK